MNQPIYLDYNATTPLSELVKAELMRLLQLDLGNPSSVHWASVLAAEIVELSRIRTASLIGCDTTEVIFTSGGTEANNHAVKGVFFANRQRRKQPHFIISSVEHPAVTKPLRFLETLSEWLLGLSRLDRRNDLSALSMRALHPKSSRVATSLLFFHRNRFETLLARKKVS